jgi:hypothetical protein
MRPIALHTNTDVGFKRDDATLTVPEATALARPRTRLRNETGDTIRITGKFPVSPLANRSISISLEEGLLAQLDAQGSNRSALVSEALVQWLARRSIDALNEAYAHLASLTSVDLADAGDAAVAMGLSALTGEGDG